MLCLVDFVSTGTKLLSTTAGLLTHAKNPNGTKHENGSFRALVFNDEDVAAVVVVNCLSLLLLLLLLSGCNASACVIKVDGRVVLVGKSFRLLHYLLRYFTYV